jgi:dipeptidyl aminopeptidase/acylaminoacyl peptidase
MHRWLVVFCSILMSVVSAVAQEKQLAPLPVQAAIAARTFSTTPFSLSNDGEWIAYALSDPRRSQLVTDERHRFITPTGTPPVQIGCDIWITNTRTQETRNLTQGKANSWAPSWSPDGSYLAFFSDRDGVANLWVWERSSEKLRKLSELPVTGYRGLSTPRWTADGKSILFCVLPEGMSIEKAALLTIGLEQNPPAPSADKFDEPTVTVFKSSRGTAASGATKFKNVPSVYIDGYVADLVVANVAERTVKRLVKGAKPCAYWPSPDGKYVAFTNVKNDAGRLRFDLMAVSLRDSQPLTLATNLQQGFVAFSVSWSPDGQISYTTSEPQPAGPPRRECYLVSLDGKQPRKIKGAPPPAGFSNLMRPPLWDMTGDSLYLTSTNALWKVSARNETAVEVARLPNRNITDIVSSTIAGRFWSPDDGRSLLVTTSDPESLRVGFSKIDLTTYEITTLVEEEKVYGGGNPLYPAALGTLHGQLIYIAEDAGRSPDFWVFEGSFSNPRRVTAINPEFDKYVMGTSSLIEWRSPSGERLRGALLLPAGYEKGKHYPMVVSFYPDEALSRQVNLFGLKYNIAVDSVNNRQLLATRGYVVLLADSRMAVGHPMQEIVRTVMPGVNKVIEMGIADPERMGIVGHSHGGYAVLGIVTQVQRFKAAVSWAGSGNLVTMYGQMDSDGTSHWVDWAEKGLGSIGGSLWEVRERYIENSPIFYLDQVKTPVLLIQGSSDRITTPNHSEEIFVGLRRLDKEVEYAKYEGEDHGFWFYPNRVDFCNRVIAWFDRWLKSAEESRFK